MSGTNDFLPFAAGGGANVESQASYAADTQRTNGNQPGVASSSMNNKAIRQASLIASQIAQTIVDITGSSMGDSATPNTTQILQQIKALVQQIPPVVDVLTSGTTWNHTSIFFCASANATVGATYTDSNATVFTVRATIAAGTLLYAQGNTFPAASGTLTKTGGTGDATITYYAVRIPLWLRVMAVGGGGGGGGSGSAGSNNGSSGGNSTFGSTLITCNGGGGGGGVSSAQGGIGGTVTVSASVTQIAGGRGSDGHSAVINTSATVFDLAGGNGGASVFGGAGHGASGTGAGAAADTNSGSGGGGGATNTTANGYGGGGGAAGGYCDAIVPTAATYAYSIGALGVAGAAGGGTTAAAGGNGAAGKITVISNYN